jgi:hypothetical protein
MEVIIMLLTKLLNANPLHTPTNIPINTLTKLLKTPTLINQEVHNPNDGGFRNARNTKVKHVYSFAHKSVAKATQKGNQLIVDSMDKMHESSVKMHESNMFMEEKHCKI